MLSPYITLHNVLHVPYFQFNLISIHKLCKDLNCHVSFTHDACFIQDPSHKGQPMLLLGKIQAGLHNVVVACSQVPSATPKSCFDVVDDVRL